MGKQTLGHKEFSSKGFMEYVVLSMQNVSRKYCERRLKKGLEHEGKKFSGSLDKFLYRLSKGYSMTDILRGYNYEPSKIPFNYPPLGADAPRRDTVPPKSSYWIGRYMGMGNEYLKDGIIRGDMETALIGVRVFEWLGQGERKSVQGKFKRAYGEALRIATEYGVPLSVEGDRRSAIMPHSLRLQSEEYLERKGLR